MKLWVIQLSDCNLSWVGPLYNQSVICRGKQWKPFSSGDWELRLPIAVGEYRFAYILEGGCRISDPALPAKEKDDFGGGNCIFDPNLYNFLMLAKVFAMGIIKKQYWIRYTRVSPFEEPRSEIAWFEFIENRNLFLKGLVRTENFKDIQFGKSIRKERDTMSKFQ